MKKVKVGQIWADKANPDRNIVIMRHDFKAGTISGFFCGVADASGNLCASVASPSFILVKMLASAFDDAAEILEKTLELISE